MLAGERARITLPTNRGFGRACRMVYYLLISRIGLDESEVAGMSKDDAVGPCAVRGAGG
jgi:hypothetical protein